MKFNFKNKKDLLSKLKVVFTNKSSIIISGGSTIKDLLKNHKYKILCKKILLSDERIVKKKSKLRNDIMFKDLIKRKIIGTRQLINYQYQDLEEQKIKIFSNRVNKLKFQYALLSLGSNGHFASIFKINNTKMSFYSVKDSPKYPKKRVTVSLSKISKCKKIIFVASRKKKEKEIKNFNKYKLVKKLPSHKVCIYTF